MSALTAAGNTVTAAGHTVTIRASYAEGIVKEKQSIGTVSANSAAAAAAASAGAVLSINKTPVHKPNGSTSIPSLNKPCKMLSRAVGSSCPSPDTAFKIQLNATTLYLDSLQMHDQETRESVGTVLAESYHDILNVFSKIIYK